MPGPQGFALSMNELKMILKEARWMCLMRAYPGQRPRLEIFDDENGDIVVEVYAHPPRNEADTKPLGRIMVIDFTGRDNDNQETSR
jgi:hypothetical protein